MDEEYYIMMSAERRFHNSRHLLIHWSVIPIVPSSSGVCLGGY